MTNQTTIMRAFNQHLKDFVDDIQQLFPENLKIRTFKNSIISFIKMNPKKPVELWFQKFCIKYYSQIMNEDIEFFLNKDYCDDVKSVEGTGININIDIVEELRGPIKELDDDNKKMAIKYLKDMTQLSKLYYS